MSKPLVGRKIAVLVANGFSEKDFTFTQKALSDTGADIRIVSMSQGLVNSWIEGGWGLNFAADQALNMALAADFDMLIVPGGQRSMQKLQLTAHTRRFIGGFVDTHKPVAFFQDAIELLAFAERAQGRTVGGAAEKETLLNDAGAQWSEDSVVVDGNIMSGISKNEAREGFVQALKAFLMAAEAETSSDEKKPIAA